MRILSILKQVYQVTRFFIKGYLIKQPSAHALGLLNTLAIVILLVFIGGSSYLPYALVGGIIALSMTPGILQMPPDLHALKKSKFYDMIKASPVNPLIFAIGFSIGASSTPFITLVIFIIILIFILGFSFNIITTIFILFLLWIISTLLGFYLANKIEYTITLFRVTGFIYTFFTYLSPVYYPIHILPASIAYISLLSPGTSTALIIKYLLNLETYNTPLLIASSIILGIYIMIMTLIVKTQYKIKS